MAVRLLLSRLGKAGEKELARCVEEALCGGIGCGKGWDKKGKGQQGKWRQIMLGERKGTPEELRALYLRVGMNFVRLLGCGYTVLRFLVFSCRFYSCYIGYPGYHRVISA